MIKQLLADIDRGSKSALNKKKILAYFMNNQSSTVPDLAKALDLSIPTVTKIIGEMCEEGYVLSYGKLETGEGRPPTVYGLNREAGYFVGVDIKKFTLNIALMNFTGDMVQTEMDIPCSLENTAEGLTELCNYTTRFIESTGIDRNKILNICINISGRVNPESGYSYSWFNFEERPLAEVLTERLGYTVSIDNDTRAMTYAELIKGAAHGIKDAMYINISWGLGAGLIIDGKVYPGKSGFSGEIGHFIVFDNEILCHCGKRGCLETEVSGEALHRSLLQAVHEGRKSILSDRILHGESPLTLNEIVEAINKEDLLCIELIEEIGQKLGRYLAGFINVLNPALVVIGGVLAQTGDYILLPIRSAMRKYSLNLVNKDTEIVVTKLQEKAGTVGACLLARSRIFFTPGETY